MKIYSLRRKIPRVTKTKIRKLYTHGQVHALTKITSLRLRGYRVIFIKNGNYRSFSIGFIRCFNKIRMDWVCAMYMMFS